ncbi:MAG: cellulose synthase catalytic subunit [Pseudomonadota bacterium]
MSHKPLKQFYFSEFEDRRPDPPLPHSYFIEFLWQISAIAAVALGAWYLHWRWTESLNQEAMVFSVLVVSAETLSYIGLLLFVVNLWAIRDTPKRACPKQLSDVSNVQGRRSIIVDVFLPTYTEDPELTRYSIRDACALRHPDSVKLNIYVLDDGNRDEMRKVAAQEGVRYLTRKSNIGYKAGNLRNGMEHSEGDFIVILDSDTRVFPSFLENTLGYFRDPKVAWVQTPQWFYDIPEGQPLDALCAERFGTWARKPVLLLQRVIGPITLNRDPFISDPKLFYDVIQRRRNRHFASFCCGAGSIHRRAAIMTAAVKDFSAKVEGQVDKFICNEKDAARRDTLKQAVNAEFSSTTELTPYKFHVSEDIYTSILLHQDSTEKWKSVYHPQVESKMLSPLDMKSWVMQRFKYAGGSLDILWNDNPIFKPGLNLHQRLYYAMTFWSYLAPLWIVVFIFAPIFSLFSGIAPVQSFSKEFFAHLLPFLIANELSSALGTWGVDNRKGKMLNIAFFSFNLQALWAVIWGREIRFQVTPKLRSADRFVRLVWPQIAVVVLSIVAILYATARQYLVGSPNEMTNLIINGFWASINAYAMTVLITAALWTPPTSLKQIDVKNRATFRRTA